jgi:hypothetical protein
MNVRMNSLDVAADTSRDLPQSERPGAGHRLQYRPAIGSENSPHKCVRSKGQSWPALGAPRKRARESLPHLHFCSDPNRHRSHCHSFARATSAQKSACNLSSDVNSYGRSRLPTCRWSPLPVSLSYRTTHLPRITYANRYLKRCSQPSNRRSTTRGRLATLQRERVDQDHDPPGHGEPQRAAM